MSYNWISERRRDDAIEWLSERRDAIKNSTSMIPDLLNIVYEYLRYMDTVTLTEYDMFNCVIDLDKKTLSTGLYCVHYDRAPLEYPIIFIHILDMVVEEKYRDSATINAIIAQPRLKYNDDTLQWCFDGDRCTDFHDKYQLRLVSIHSYNQEIYMRILPVKDRGQRDFDPYDTFRDDVLY